MAHLVRRRCIPAPRRPGKHLDLIRDARAGRVHQVDQRNTRSRWASLLDADDLLYRAPRPRTRPSRSSRFAITQIGRPSIAPAPDHHAVGGELRIGRVREQARLRRRSPAVEQQAFDALALQKSLRLRRRAWRAPSRTPATTAAARDRSSRSRLRLLTSGSDQYAVEARGRSSCRARPASRRLAISGRGLVVRAPELPVQGIENCVHDVEADQVCQGPAAPSDDCSRASCTRR